MVPPRVPDAPGRTTGDVRAAGTAGGRALQRALAVRHRVPVEAHMLNKAEYTSMFGYSPQPYADGADKKERLAEVERVTNQRMTDIVAAAPDAAGSRRTRPPQHRGPGHLGHQRPDLASTTPKRVRTGDHGRQYVEFGLAEPASYFPVRSRCLQPG